MEPNDLERLRINDIFGVVNSLGEDQWETLEHYQLNHIELIAGTSPLVSYLSKRFLNSTVDVSLVCIEHPDDETGPFNGIKAVDELTDMEVILRIPYHVVFVEDYWQDMVDSSPELEPTESEVF